MASPKTYRLMNFIENNLALVLISIAIIIVERIVKFYITESLRIGESIPVIGSFFMITRTENIGAGFGVLAGQSIIFIAAAILVLLLIVYFYNKIIYDRLLVFSSAFILAGTVGNLMDRLFFGHVIDYIDFSFWPTFNLSDVSLVIGAALLLLYMYRWQEEPEKEKTYIHY
ncbi:signal peptidase II [Candidatus Woesearchaeota archaeon]|nr:signal peptidase II [Candidatus Woesearchaeota archaeon]